MNAPKITPFLFDGEITVRVIERDGEPLFVAVDVCRALGLSNAAEAVRGLDEDEKGISTTDTLGGHQEVVVISESGLYALIFKCRKPHALRFRKWVTGEVLPALRRQGVYVMPPSLGSGAVAIAAKPYLEWSLEERRLNLSEVNAARHTFNQAAAVWTWQRLGLPMPPRHLLPGWWQGELINQAGLPAN